jgi:thioredoxin 1
MIYCDDVTFETEVLNSITPVFVDFYADWCAPCKLISPLVDELAEKYKDKVKVVKVNVDHAPNISIKYSIETIPTLITFSNGLLVRRITGFTTKVKLEEMFNEI